MGESEDTEPMPPHTLVALFYSAQDARRAMSALRGMAEVVADGPEPLPRPQNGRAWSLTLLFPVDASSVLYMNPQRVDQIVAVVRRFNGEAEMDPIKR